MWANTSEPWPINARFNESWEWCERDKYVVGMIDKNNARYRWWEIMNGRDMLDDETSWCSRMYVNKSCGHGIYSGSTCASNKMFTGWDMWIWCPHQLIRQGT